MAKKKSYTKNQVDSINKKYESMLNNTNAEKYDINRAKDIFLKAIDMSNEICTRNNERGITCNDVYKYDFIGEITREMKSYKEIFNQLVKRFPELNNLNNVLHSNIESNCLHNTKRGIIKEQTGLTNLKSNYKWTDRTQIDLSAEQKKLQDLFPEIPENQ